MSKLIIINKKFQQTIFLQKLLCVDLYKNYKNMKNFNFIIQYTFLLLAEYCKIKK